MAMIEITFPSEGPPGKVLKWKIHADTIVMAGKVLLLYQNVTSTEEDAAKEPEEKKLRSPNFGRLRQILVNQGDIIQPGQVIALLEGCTHPAVMIDLCAQCGVDLRIQESNKDGMSHASVPMVHSVPELKVCPELAEKIGKKDEQRLLKDRKLVLLVDLDQTIVHTTNDNVSVDLKDVHHFQLYGSNSPWYHTRLRPNTRHFLSEMSRLYELHICTFGARIYAHTVASLLDKDGILFSHRILSRDECFDPASKTANLKALFPCGNDLVCIIDDREDVWQGCGNLVKVKPYHFFRHTGDINAPPGLEKGNLSHGTELINKSCTSNSQNKDGKNNEFEVSSETEQSPSSCSTKKAEKNDSEKNDSEKNDSEKNDSEKNDSEKNDSEKNEEDEENEKTESETKEAESTDNKATVKEDAGSSDAQLDTTNENDETSKEITKVTLSVKTGKDNKQETESNVTDEDDDDYLLYLEDILRRIHTEFYATLEQGKSRKSLRNIIPRVRSRVLKGLYLTFSGLIPTHQKLDQSRAYKIARAFGAEVSQDLMENTTHLVAIRKGTAKVNAAKKNSQIKIVNPEWLWTCAERWEQVDERLFPLTSQIRGSRVPPPHCSPERFEEVDNDKINFLTSSNNPLMSLSQEEIEFMDKEVDENMEDTIHDENESMDDLDEYSKKRSFDSDESINEDFNLEKKKKISESYLKDYKNPDEPDDNSSNDNNDDDEDFAAQREENMSTYLDLDDSQDSLDNDEEWNALGAVLERKFLSE